MKLSSQGSVPVYTISGSSTARPLPEWLARKRRRSLKHDPEFANRIELLQDFEFEEASSCIRVSDDGDWVMSTGTYKPQMHVHYLPHLSLSFARHTPGLNQTFILLSTDYSKSLHLQTDRFLEFHTPHGCHYTTRIPRYGRDLKYDKRLAEALIPSVGVDSNGMGEVFRLNLEVGRYMKPYAIDVGGDDFSSLGGGALQGGIRTGSVNTSAIAEDSHNLLAFGTSIGTVELWDPRNRGRIGILQPPRAFTKDLFDSGHPSAEITCLEFDRTGLSLATGSSSGLIHLYDLRSPVPLLKKDQGYGYPIHTLTFLDSARSSSSSNSSGYDITKEPKILSSDKRIIKIWDSRTGAPWTHIETAVDLNSVTWCKDTGMILTANEGRQQHSFFVPQLGPAPRWCSFLDNLVEEMAEDGDDPSAFTSAHKPSEIYDNYKFVTLADLKALGLADKIGTKLFKPYMHGYFMRQELFDEAKLVAQPELWEEVRQKSIREKIEKERESRIRGIKKPVNAKVNKRLAERILEQEEKNEKRKARRILAKAEASAEEAESTTGAAENSEVPVEQSSMSQNVLLTDSRFESLFQDQDFAIDEASHEFRALNPSTKVFESSNPRTSERLTAVEKEELIPRRRSDSSLSSSDSSDGGENNHKDRGQGTSADNTKISTSSYRKENHRKKERLESRKQGKQGTTMRVGSSTAKDTGWSTSEFARNSSFGSRAARLKEAGGGEGVGAPRGKDRGTGKVYGQKEMTFTPSKEEKRNSKIHGRAAAGGGNLHGANATRPNKDRRSASGNTLRRL